MRNLPSLFSVSTAHLLRRKLVLSAFVVSAGFLALYWLLCSQMSKQSGIAGMQASDMALGALLMTFPAAATMVSAFVFILGSSVLPDEIQSGRAAYWAALPVSRTEIFAGFGLSTFAACVSVSLFVFGGIAGITHACLPYVETSIPSALGAFLLWHAVLWSSVTLLSLLVHRMVAIIVCFSAWGVSTFLGGLAQVARSVPGEPVARAIVTASEVSAFVFPADQAFRTMVSGLLPSGARLEDMMAFAGATAGAPALQIGWSALAAVILTVLAARRFARADLR